MKDLINLNIASILRNLLGVFRSKIVTLLLGVEGVGVLGQIITFFGVQNKLVTFGFDTIIVNRLGKLDPENDRDNYAAILIFSFFMMILVNVVLLGVLLIFIDDLSELIFGTTIYRDLFLYLIVLGPIYAVAYGFEIISQARTQFNFLVFGRILSIVSAMILLYPLIYYFGLLGIVFDLYVMIIIGGIYFVYKNKAILSLLTIFSPHFIRSNLKLLLTLGFTDIFRKLFVFFSIMAFRIIIVQTLGLKSNGLFQAAWSISYYPDIFLAGFISYYFPTISKVTAQTEIKKTLNQNFETLAYLLFPIITLLLFLPDLLIYLFFSRDFFSMVQPLKILLLLKYLEGIYYFFNITFLGQTKIKYFLICEVVRSTTMVVGALLLIPIFDLNGAVWAIVLMQLISILVSMATLSFNKELIPSRKTIFLFIKILFLNLVLLLPIEQILPLRIGLFILIFILGYFILDYKKYYEIFYSFRRKES